MGRNPTIVELAVVALVMLVIATGPIACSTEPVADGVGVSGLQRDLVALFFTVNAHTPKTIGGPFALTDRPVLEATLVAVDSSGDQSTPKVEKFPYPLEWYFQDSGDALVCEFTNQGLKSSVLECREPGYRTPCVKTVIDGRPVSGCNTFKFQ